MPPEYDVVVVGAGPAGSATASLLARSGHRVALLDRAHFPRRKACAEFMSPGVIDALVRLGLDQPMDAARPLSLHGMDIISPVGSRVRINYVLGGNARAARTLPRHTFDTILVRHAIACGAEMMEGFTVHEPIMESGVVTGVRGSSGGKAIAVRGKLTVVADGSRSVLARHLGLTKPPLWPVRLGLVAHYEGAASLPHGYGAMLVGGGGYCGVAPLPDGQLNVAMVLPLDTVSRSHCNATQVFERWIVEHPLLRDTLRGCTRSTSVYGVGPVGSRSRRSWAPGALLVGDAASFFDPLTGEGIYRALTGAEIASGVARDALSKGVFSAATLRIHDGLRSRAFRKKEGVTALVQLFVQYPTLMEYALPRLSGRQGTREILGRVLGDITDAGEFLRPRALWDALRP